MVSKIGVYDRLPNLGTGSVLASAAKRPYDNGYGFAARCEAVALPRRLPASTAWAVPVVRAWPRV